jgi:hypothetical protein
MSQPKKFSLSSKAAPWLASALVVASLGGRPDAALAQIHQCSPGDDPFSCLSPPTNICVPNYEPGLSSNGFRVTWSVVISCWGPYGTRNDRLEFGRFAGRVDAFVDMPSGQDRGEHLDSVGPGDRTFSFNTQSCAVRTGSYNCETTVGSVTTVTAEGELFTERSGHHAGSAQVHCN